MTLTPETRDARTEAIPVRPHRGGTPPRPQRDNRPVEFWPTSAIHAALEQDDLAVWQSIVTAIKRDPVRTNGPAGRGSARDGQSRTASREPWPKY